MNDAPAVTVPSGQTVAEDGSVYFGAIQVSDVDAGETAGATVRVTLTVDNGVLFVSTAVPGGLVGGNVQQQQQPQRHPDRHAGGDQQDSRRTPPACSIGRPRISSAAISVNVTVSDLGNTGQPGAQTTVTTFTIAVTPSNDRAVGGQRSRAWAIRPSPSARIRC